MCKQQRLDSAIMLFYSTITEGLQTLLVYKLALSFCGESNADILIKFKGLR